MIEARHRTIQPHTDPLRGPASGEPWRPDDDRNAVLRGQVGHFGERTSRRGRRLGGGGLAAVRRRRTPIASAQLDGIEGWRPCEGVRRAMQLNTGREAPRSARLVKRSRWTSHGLPTPPPAQEFAGGRQQRGAASPGPRTACPFDSCTSSNPGTMQPGVIARHSAAPHYRSWKSRSTRDLRSRQMRTRADMPF